MRLPDGPMTRDEFEEILAAAQHGEMLSDTGASDALDAALIDIVFSADPMDPDLASRARLAFAAMTDDGSTIIPK